MKDNCKHEILIQQNKDNNYMCPICGALFLNVSETDKIHNEIENENIYILNYEEFPGYFSETCNEIRLVYEFYENNLPKMMRAMNSFREHFQEIYDYEYPESSLKKTLQKKDSI